MFIIDNTDKTINTNSELNQNDNALENLSNSLKKPTLKIITIFIWLFLFLFTCSLIIELFEEKTTKEQNNPTLQMNNNLIYQDRKLGIYAFHIPQKDFQLKQFVNYSQNLPKDKKGTYINSFVFNEKVNLQELNNINKSIPLYSLQVLFDKNPYFYFSGCSNIQEDFYKIQPGQQEIYKRNIVKGEKLFSHIATTHHKKISVLNLGEYSDTNLTKSKLTNNTRQIYSYDNLGRAGLATFVYNTTTAIPSSDFYYHYTNNSPYRLQVSNIYSDYIFVAGNLYDSYIRPTKDLAIKPIQHYVNGQLLKDNTYYKYIGILDHFGRKTWAFEEIKITPVN